MKIAVIISAVLLQTTLPLVADTIEIPIPEWVGVYELQQPPNVSVDVGFGFDVVEQVEIHLVGEIVPGVGVDPSGATFDWPAEFLPWFPPPGDFFLASYSQSGPFDVVLTFDPLFGATWDFFLDGSATIAMDFASAAFIGFPMMTQYPVGTITSATLIVTYDGGGPPGESFVRGDCNADGNLDISDAIFGLSALFSGGAATCERACDANDDDAFDISDMIYDLSALFVAGSAPPPAPYPGCGTDPTPGTLPCATFPACP